MQCDAKHSRSVTYTKEAYKQSGERTKPALARSDGISLTLQTTRSGQQPSTTEVCESVNLCPKSRVQLTASLSEWAQVPAGSYMLAAVKFLSHDVT